MPRSDTPQTGSSEPEELGRRLKAAREALGLPQIAVADALSIPRPSISELEAGRRRVSVIELKRFAALYRRPISYFYDDERTEADSDDVVEALFRTTSSLSDNDRAQVLRFAEFLKAAGPAVSTERSKAGRQE